MIHLDFDDKEKEELREFLQHYLNFLKLEIRQNGCKASRSTREGPCRASY